MLLIQTRNLGQGWSMQIRYGKRVTYALKLRGYQIKSFYSEESLKQWLRDLLGVDLGEINV